MVPAPGGGAIFSNTPYMPYTGKVGESPLPSPVHSIVTGGWVRRTTDEGWGRCQMRYNDCVSAQWTPTRRWRSIAYIRSIRSFQATIHFAKPICAIAQYCRRGCVASTKRS